ncbi:helix-turn-helix transcriptional regulator [Lentzea sp. BCCO 10_0856]|uniref:Helix-turn-helix transcriptional regulator n=1 Tax=Lentzea miocenica TaxID=3095431 RepID=A0ABU4TGP4_9PSEU|nr:helix-turn-helix transcriptional regulator [Lentzea sp. BCCO 10_0856]MDX8037032.1 helix-turn-helix transcriptional regulator [Lentzea sp. BCCO 10_0856]
MPKRYSTARGREFGERLRAAIAQAGMTSRQLADLLGWQEAKVSDMVNGKGGVTTLELAVVLGVCRVPESEREYLLGLFPATELNGWWQPHGKCTPVRSHTAHINLAAAKTLVSWHPHAIPDLLRTADYSRHLLAASATVPATELDERLRALHGMQELLRNGLDCTFFIHEFALELQVGERDEHVAQLQHLMRMANWKKIRILVLPAAVGAHAGMAGPFTLLKFPKYQPLIWTTTENSSLFVEEERAVEGYETVVQALNEISLDEDQSMKWISRRYVRLQESEGAEDLIREDEDEPFPPL